MSSDKLFLEVARASNPLLYGIKGFSVERPGYQLKVAAFYKRIEKGI